MSDTQSRELSGADFAANTLGPFGVEGLAAVVVVSACRLQHLKQHLSDWER